MGWHSTRLTVGWHSTRQIIICQVQLLQVKTIGQVTAISVARASIQRSAAIKSLDVILDSQLTMDKRVVGVSKVCYFHIRAPRHIRKAFQLTICRDVRDKLCQATASIENSRTRRDWPQEQRSHHLADLHWLPIRSRMTFTIASLTYSIRKSGNRHNYLGTLISDHKPTRDLRSSSHDLMAMNARRR